MSAIALLLYLSFLAFTAGTPIVVIVASIQNLLRSKQERGSIVLKGLVASMSSLVLSGLSFIWGSTRITELGMGAVGKDVRPSIVGFLILLNLILGGAAVGLIYWVSPHAKKSS